MSEQAEKGEWPTSDIPDTWKWVGFSEFFRDSTDSRRKIPKKNYLHDGKYQVIDQGEDQIGGFSNDSTLVSIAKLPCIVWGDHTKCVKLIEDKFIQGADGVKVLEPTAAIDPSFAYQALKTVHLPDKGYSRHFKFLSSTQFPVPPLPEQRRIVTKLDSLFARSKAARDELARIPLLIEHYKQAILEKAFSGELTADWRINNTSDSGAEERRLALQEERDSKRRNNGIRAKGKNRSLPGSGLDLPAIPKSWAWIVFEDCSWDLTVGHVGSMKDRYVENGIPFLRSLNVRANRVVFEKIVFIDEEFHNELQKSKLQGGDLVVVRTGEPGIAAVIPEYIEDANCSDLVICRLVDAINPKYAAFYMNSAFAREAVSRFQVGVAQQHFNVGAMSVMPLPFPQRAEQDLIVEKIETAMEWLHIVAVERDKAAQLLDHLDQGLLAKAFRGELVPQDPDDEPAEMLLERMRAARRAQPQSRRGRRARAGAAA